jgi:hypothetical protein
VQHTTERLPGHAEVCGLDIQNSPASIAQRPTQYQHALGCEKSIYIILRLASLSSLLLGHTTHDDATDETASEASNKERSETDRPQDEAVDEEGELSGKEADYEASSSSDMDVLILLPENLETQKWTTLSWSTKPMSSLTATQTSDWAWLTLARTPQQWRL